MSVMMERKLDAKNLSLRQILKKCRLTSYQVLILRELLLYLFKPILIFYFLCFFFSFSRVSSLRKIYRKIIVTKTLWECSQLLGGMEFYVQIKSYVYQYRYLISEGYVFCSVKSIRTCYPQNSDGTTAAVNRSSKNDMVLCNKVLFNSMRLL